MLGKFNTKETWLPRDIYIIDKTSKQFTAWKYFPRRCPSAWKILVYTQRLQLKIAFEISSEMSSIIHLCTYDQADSSYDFAVFMNWRMFWENNASCRGHEENISEVVLWATAGFSRECYWPHNKCLLNYSKYFWVKINRYCCMTLGALFI